MLWRYRLWKIPSTSKADWIISLLLFLRTKRAAISIDSHPLHLTSGRNLSSNANLLFSILMKPSSGYPNFSSLHLNSATLAPALA